MLTSNGITMILNGAEPINFQPIVQIVKIVQQQNRFILSISDGIISYQAIYMSTEFKEALESGLITVNHIIKLVDYCVNRKIQDSPFFIFQFEQRFNVNCKLGNPKKLKTEEFKEIKILYTPILEIQKYQSWIVKARVLTKSKIEYWSNAKTKGKYFKILIIDHKGTKAQGIFFRERVDKFFNLVDPGKIYSFSKGIVKVPKKRFNKEEAAFEIEFIQSSLITEVEEDQEIPIQDKFTPTPIIKKFDPEISPFDNSPVRQKSPESYIESSQIPIIHSEETPILTTFAQISYLENSRKSLRSDNFNVLCTIGKLSSLKVNEKMYPGCLNFRCKKKVVEINHGIYYCSRCDREYNACKYLYRLILPLIDSTKTFHVKVFNSIACSLIGKSADQLNYLNTVDKVKAENLLFKVFGKNIVAQIQMKFKEGEPKEYVLVSAKSGHTIMKTLLKDIGEIVSML